MEKLKISFPQTNKIGSSTLGVVKNNHKNIGGKKFCTIWERKTR
jgi:hypothetical protein